MVKKASLVKLRYRLSYFIVFACTLSYLTLYRPAIPFGNRKIYFRGFFQLGIVTIKKISPSGNLKFNYLGIFQSLKLRISMGKILSISLQLDFTPITLAVMG